MYTLCQNIVATIPDRVVIARAIRIASVTIVLVVRELVPRKKNADIAMRREPVPRKKNADTVTRKEENADTVTRKEQNAVIKNGTIVIRR